MASEFHPKQTKAHIAGGNAFTRFSKASKSLRRFSLNSVCSTLVKNLCTEFHENPTIRLSLILGHRQTDERGLYVRRSWFNS